MYEYKPTGTAFSGSPITNSVSSSGMQSSFTNLGTTGTNLNEDVTDVPTNDNYRWRVRIMYDKASNPYQVYGPWRYYESFQPLSFGSFKSQNTPLPVEFSTFTAMYRNGKVELFWYTASEVNNYGFEILSSAQNDDWTKIGFVAGHGNSNSPKDYSFIDENPKTGINKYRLNQIDFDGKYEYSEIVEVNIILPTNFALEQNYPNPFNPITTIKFKLAEDIFATLKIYDILGQEVATLVNEYLKSGTYSYSFDARKLTSKVYFYKLQAGTNTQSRKMILLK